jgi:curved DNA-binding protein CbpA
LAVKGEKDIMSGPGSCPSLYVDKTIANKAKILIQKNQNGSSSSVREGLEMLLNNDLSIGSDINTFIPPSSAMNVGELLQDGLRILANAPHSTLDIDLSAQTIDVRKAYKKMALKYHPDKNPRTTPIFQAIQGAHEKLTDKVKRKEEEEKAKRAAALSKPPERAPYAAASGPSQPTGAYSYQPKQQQQQQPPQQQSQQSRKPEPSHQSSSSQRSQSNPRPAPAPPPSSSKRYSSDDQDSEEKYRQGGYGYQGEYRFQEAQKKAREREEERRSAASASAAPSTRGGAWGNQKEPPLDPKSVFQKFQEGRQREYQEAAARAAERRGGVRKPHGSGQGGQGAAPRGAPSPSYSHQKTMKKTKKFTSTLSSSSSEPAPGAAINLTSLPCPTGLRGEVIDPTTVELCWNPVPIKLSSIRGLKVQLSWRLWSGYNLDKAPKGAGMGTGTGTGEQWTQWETATVYLNGEKVRKKNLMTKKKYEFRIRYVFISETDSRRRAGGGGGGGGGAGGGEMKGQWCNPIKLHLISSSTQQQQQQSHKQYQQTPHTQQPRRGSFAEEVSDEEEAKKEEEDTTPAEEVPSDEEEHTSPSPPSRSSSLPMKQKTTSSTSTTPHSSFPAWYQLLPPPDTITRKSLAGEPIRYIVSLHKSNRSSTEIVGYISNSREILIQKISGNWILAQAHWKNSSASSSCSSSSSSASQQQDSSHRSSGVVWGYCEFKVYSEMLGKEYQLFQPITQPQQTSSSSTTTSSSYAQQHTSQESNNSSNRRQKKIPKKFPANPFSRPQPYGAHGAAAGAGVGAGAGAAGEAAEDVDVDESEGYDSFYYQPSAAAAEKRGVDIWVQKYDETTGHFYYYNASTGQSEWEAPEWVEEKDPASGARLVSNFPLTFSTSIPPSLTLFSSVFSFPVLLCPLLSSAVVLSSSCWVGIS